MQEKWTRWIWRWRPELCLAAVCGLVFFLNLGTARLWDRDEPRNAGCAQEMLERGDWIVPIFNDQLRHQKPVMLYWLMMSGYLVFGESEFAARFWSALLGAGTVWLTYRLGTRLFGPASGFWGGLILATSLMFTVASHAATPDATFVFFITAALYVYVSFMFDRGGSLRGGTGFPGNRRITILFYAILGLAVLTKGLAGFVLPMAIVGLFMLLARQTPVGVGDLEGMGRLQRSVHSIIRLVRPLHFLRTLMAMRPLIGVAVVTAVAGPWFLAVGLKTDGDFARLFFLDEHLGRFSTTFENHSGGWWYYPIAILVGLFPWSVFTWPTIAEIDRRLTARRDWATVFLLSWVGVTVGLFSLAATKLPSYVTPCYPALALLFGDTIARFVEGRSRVRSLWFRLSAATLMVTGCGVAVGMGWLGQVFLGGKGYLAVIALPLIVAGSVSVMLIPQRRGAMMAGLGGAAVTFFALFWGWGAGVVDSTREIQTLLAEVRSFPESTRVATYRCLESSWVLYGGHPIWELDPHPTGVDELASDRTRELVEVRRDWEPLPRMVPEAFVETYPNSVLVTTQEHVEELLRRLPAGYRVIATAPYFLRDQQVLLVASGEAQAARVAAGPVRHDSTSGFLR